MQTIIRWNSVFLAAALTMGLGIAAVHAQGPDGAPSGRPGGGPPPPPVTAATIPVSTLTTELVLSSSQQTKIQTIQKTFQDERRTLAPPPPRPGESGQDGAPPAPPAPPSDVTRAKIKALDEDASQQVEAVLTDTQKTALTSLIKTLRALQAAGIPPRVYAELNLTADQKQQIVGIAATQRSQDKAAIETANGDPDTVRSILGESRRKTHDAVLAVLTDTQKALAGKSRSGARPWPKRRLRGTRPARPAPGRPGASASA